LKLESELNSVKQNRNEISLSFKKANNEISMFNQAMIAFGVVGASQKDNSLSSINTTEYRSLDNLKIIFKENERLKSELSAIMEITVKERANFDVNQRGAFREIPSLISSQYRKVINEFGTNVKESFDTNNSELAAARRELEATR
jgi:ABC-type tungstate transport system permease subunit